MKHFYCKGGPFLRSDLISFGAHDGQPLGKGNDERNADTDGAEHDAVDEFLTSLTVSLGVHS